MKPFETIDFGLFDFEFDGAKSNVPAKVTVYVYHDDSSSVDDLCDPVAFPEDAARIRSGELSPFIVVVKARVGACEGTDSLGACLLTHDLAVNDIISDHGMVFEALSALVADLKTQEQLLQLIRGAK